MANRLHSAYNYDYKLIAYFILKGLHPGTKLLVLASNGRDVEDYQKGALSAF